MILKTLKRSLLVRRHEEPARLAVGEGGDNLLLDHELPDERGPRLDHERAGIPEDVDVPCLAPGFLFDPLQDAPGHAFSLIRRQELLRGLRRPQDEDDLDLLLDSIRSQKQPQQLWIRINLV